MDLTRVIVACENPTETVLPVGTIVSEGQVLCNGDVVVVECSPVTKGIIADCTVVIAGISDSCNPEQYSRENLTKKMIKLPTTDSQHSDTFISAFCRPSRMRLKVRICTKLLPKNLSHTDLDIPECYLRDTSNKIYCTNETKQVYGLQTHVIINHNKQQFCFELCLPNNENNFKVDDSVFLVQPGTYCNLFWRSNTFRPSASTDIHSECVYLDKTGTLKELSIKTASWAEIALVMNPLLVDIPTAVVDEVISSLFTSRLVHVSDVISVPISSPIVRSALLKNLSNSVILDFEFLCSQTTYPSEITVSIVKAATTGDHSLEGTPFIISREGTELSLTGTPCKLFSTPKSFSGGEFPTECLSAAQSVLIFMEKLAVIHNDDSEEGAFAGSLAVVGPPDSYVRESVAAAAASVGLNMMETNCSDADIETVIGLIKIACDTGNTVLLATDIDSLFSGKDGNSVSVGQVLSDLQKATNQQRVIVVGSYRTEEDMPGLASTFFQQKIIFNNPTQIERASIYDILLNRIVHSRVVTSEKIAKATAGLPASGLLEIVSHAVNNCSALVCDDLTCDLQGGIPIVQMSHFTTAISKYTSSHQISVSTNVQKVSWKDIGGLKEAKEEIMKCIHLPLTQPQLYSGSGLKARTGILMFGPPGCGKTLLAKGVATECGLNFMSVKGPELLNMYVGESERNVRELFQKAREAAPCVVFFDELDALVPNRGAKGDSAGVMDRIVAQLLTEVDSLGGDPDEFVFIIGATNRPDLIDQSLLRPGRFDKCVYLGVAGTSAEQATILKAQTRKMKLDDDVDFLAITEEMPKTYSGADMYSLSTEALMIAMRSVVDDMVAKVQSDRDTEVQKIADSQLDESDSDSENNEENSSNNLSSIVVTQKHLIQAREASTPSITPTDLKRYLAMKEQFA